jgi:protein-L-isoaspartate(D-aspartate) O-methyltransferase
MAWEVLRQKMVEEQIRMRGVRDPAVLRAMQEVPRQEFVPLDELTRAYDDCPLPIGFGQTISQPYIVGLMTELLAVTAEHKVLEVGTGSGYQTAILAALAREVFTIDIHEELVQAAWGRLRRLGTDNVHFAVRNGHLGWIEAAPFDRIIVTAGAVSVPQPLVEQLVVGGRMVIPVGSSQGDQVLRLLVKTDSFHMDIRDSVPVRFVPLIHDLEGP